MKKSPALLLFFAAVAAIPSAVAVSVVTDPVGFISIAAKAGSTTYIGLSMTPPVVYQGPAASAAISGQVTVVSTPNGGFSTSQFGPGAGSVPNFYLEVTNGLGAGTMSEITSHTATSITLADDITSAFASNGSTTFKIRPNWTFGTAFGTANESGLQASTSPTGADILNIINPINGSGVGYYYNSTLAKWVTVTGDNDATNVPIAPDAGLQLTRKGSTDLSFKLAGAVKTGPSALFVNGDTSVSPVDNVTQLENPYPMESVLLKDLGLYTGSASSGVVGGSSPSTADLVRIYDFAHNQVNDYYYNTSPTELKWKTGTSDASATVIPAGASVAVVRRASRQGFYWFVPQPGMVLGDTPLPLTLVSAASRKSHGTALTDFGSADVNLPLTGGIGVESRNPGSGGTHSVVLNFSNPIVSGGASIVSGSATVGTPTFNGKTMIVPLTSVGDQQQVVIAVSNVTDTYTQIVSKNIPIKFLSGDNNGDSVVNISDIGLIRNSSSPGNVTLGNIRADLNNDGSINISDIGLSRSKSGNSAQ